MQDEDKELDDWLKQTYERSRRIMVPRPRPAGGGSQTPAADIFVFAGQSNAQTFGRVVGELPGYIVADAGIQIWNHVGAAFQQYAASTNSDQPGNIGAFTGAYWGSEAEFAYRWRQDNPGTAIYILKFAVPQTQLFQSADGVTTLDWNTSSAASELFGQLESDIAAAKASLASVGRVGVVRNIFWMQGETDATDATKAAAYLTNLTALHTAARVRWGDANSKLTIGRTYNNLAYAQRATVRAAQVSVAALSAFNTWLNTDGFTLSDGDHFNAAGVSQFGKDAYFAYKYGHQEFVTNRTFDTNLSGWTAYSFNGSAIVADASVGSVVSGRMRLTSSAGHQFADAVFPLTGLRVGATYKVSVDYFGGTSNKSFVRITPQSDGSSSGALYNSGDLTGDGTQDFSFVATASTLYLTCITDDTINYTEYDNVSVVGPS